MTVSDYIMSFLVSKGIKDLFLISGGGMMHLLDAACRNPELNLYFNLNEQASSICAESYSQFTHNIGACMVTTGPGATNAITGCAGAWVDSTPVIYISGQCRTQQMGQLKGLRIYGAQEIAIIPCVKPITKYAETVLYPEEIRFHLEKAYHLAMSGRKGPVWLDIPLDVQNAQINSEELTGFTPNDEDNTEYFNQLTDKVNDICSLINSSDRPAILIGHGAVAANIQPQLRDFVSKHQIPVLATWRAKGIFGDEEPLYMGSPGIPGTRYSNYCLQNCDFLLIIGSRLNPAITAYDEPHFAGNARKVIVDIEEKEIAKLDIDFDISVVSDAGNFFKILTDNDSIISDKDRSEWLDYCRFIKEKYPLSNETQPYDNEGMADGYLLAKVLSDYSNADDIFIGSSSGRSCGISHMAYNLKRGQRFVTSMGLGSMGWCIPSAIACSIAGDHQRTLLIEGDGSLQHNIQELQLISTYDLPIKLFVLSNSGYASIYSMQRNNFDSRFAGCNEDSGLLFPNIKDVAQTYKLNYYCIHDNSEIDETVKKIMSDDSPCLCEVIISVNFDEIPKSMTVIEKDGSFRSSKLENMYPFVSDEDQKENMPNWS